MTEPGVYKRGGQGTATKEDSDASISETQSQILKLLLDLKARSDEQSEVVKNLSTKVANLSISQNEVVSRLEQQQETRVKQHQPGDVQKIQLNSSPKSSGSSVGVASGNSAPLTGRHTRFSQEKSSILLLQQGAAIAAIGALTAAIAALN